MREHGKIIFLDLKDWTGLAQVVFPPDFEKQETVKRLTLDSTCEISGIVQERPANTANPQIATGNVEIMAKNLEVFSLAKTFPDL